MMKDTCDDTKVAEKRRHMIREVPLSYSATRHLLTNICLALFPAVVMVCILALRTITAWDLLAVPAGFIVGNFIEYVVHRWPMHRPKVPLGRFMFKRHTGLHHRLFTHDDVEINDPRDWYFVMLPPLNAAGLTLLLTALTIAVWPIIGMTTACVFGITLSTYFVLEELLHLSFHLGSVWRGTGIFSCLLRWLGRAHRAHHELKVMSNEGFNIAFPLFDVLFGTRIVHTHR